MKKILFAICAAAAMSAACTQFEKDQIPSYDTVAAPEITATVVSDTEISVTVTAGENTSFYGYAVLLGAPGADAEGLVAGQYAKSADVVLQGEDKEPQAAHLRYSEETKSVTLELSDLTPFTEYTVYAAAVTEMGVTSEVAAKTVRTTDGTLPTPDPEAAAYEEADGALAFMIPFSDPVTLTGEGTAKAYFFAQYDTDAQGYLQVYKEVDIPAENIAAEGDALYLIVPAEEYIPGAYVSVTFSADLVANGAGTKNAAFEDHLMAWYDGEIVWNGIAGQYGNANWDFSLVDPATLPDEPEEDSELGKEEGEEEEEEKVPVYFSDWTTLVMKNYTTSEYPLAMKADAASVEIIVKEANGRKVSYAADNFDIMDPSFVGVALSEAPAFGGTVSYTIGKGSFRDIFGNENNEFSAEDEYFCSFGYTLDDITGEYLCDMTSYYYGPYPEKTAMAIEAYAPAAEEDLPGNVKITKFNNIECDKPIVGTFDPVIGTLTVPSGQVYVLAHPDWVYDGEGNLVLDEDGNPIPDPFTGVFVSGDMESPVVFSMPESGVLCNSSLVFAIYGVWSEGKGFYDAFTQMVAVKAAAAPSPASARKEAPKHRKIRRTL